MKALILFFSFIPTFLLGQLEESKTFTNDTPIPIEKLNLFDAEINQITLNPDSTFQFYSIVGVSCFAWRDFSGKWLNINDTIFFFYNYEITERDIKFEYDKIGDKPFYEVSFHTDKNSTLVNRNVKVQYVYDFEAEIENVNQQFKLDLNNTLHIPFSEIPNHKQLASIKIEYWLNDKEKREDYITESILVNLRRGDLPNIIHCLIIEKPRTEQIKYELKGLIEDENLRIVSFRKTESDIKDLHGQFIFQNIYHLGER